MLISYFVVGLAILDLNGKRKSAVVYDPIARELYVAEAGRGAYLVPLINLLDQELGWRK